MSSKRESKTGGRKRRIGGKLKQTKYCRLMMYINDKDPDFGEAIDRLCITGDLMPHRGENGVTLLWPKDDKYRKEVVDAMSSGREEEALKMIRSLIIPDYIKNVGELKSKAVGNRLGARFDSKSPSGIAPDVEVEASDFKWLRKFDKQEQNVNVLFLKKGRPPTESGERYMPPLRPKRTGMGKETKSVKGGSIHMKSVIVRGLVDAIMQGKDAEYACSLLVYLKHKSPADYAAVLPLLNWEPAVTVLTLVNCVREDSLPNEVCGLGTAKKYVELLSASGGAGLIAGDQIAQAQTSVRKNIAGDLSAVNIVEKINALYDGQLKGMVGTVGKVFSDATVGMIGSVAKKKWLDEMTYMVGTAMSLVRNDPRSDKPTIEQIFADYWCGSRTGANYEAELYITAKSTISQSVNRQVEFDCLRRFIASSAFLYVLLPKAQASQASGEMASVPPAMFNVEASACARLDGIAASEPAKPAMMEYFAKEWAV